MPAAVWPLEMKQDAYELSVQGFTSRQIEAELRTRYGSSSPSDSTILAWLHDPDAQPVLDRIRHRVKSIVAHRTNATLNKLYDRLDEALDGGDLRQVDAGARAVVGLTRGFVADRVELEPPKAVGGDTELRALLAAHGVNLASSDNPAANTP